MIAITTNDHQDATEKPIMDNHYSSVNGHF